MSEDHEIKVYVCEYPDRANLVMIYADPISGRRKSKSAGTSNRKEAEKAAAVWEAALRDGRYSSPSKTTWLEFRNRYESEVMPGLAAGTQSRIDTVFDRIVAVLNPQRLRDITSQRLSWLVAELRKDVKQGEETKPGLNESSIQSYMAHLKAALRWAERVGMIVKAPLFPKIQRAKGNDAMKGRAPTGEEFDRMIEAVPKVVGEGRAAEWVRYLRGLWYSGFRVTESLALSWDEGEGIVVDLSGRYPVAHIPAAAQKSHRTETLPLAPEFAAMLAETPAEQRTGFVFNPQHERNQRSTRDTTIRIVAEIGRQAGVKVWTNPKGGKAKCASAHDLRRAFGLRWSSRVMPAVLQQMMRHATIETTLKFYVGKNAQTSAGVIWDAFNKTLPVVNNSVNSTPETTSGTDSGIAS